jgi:hypothetical protein
MLLPASKSRSNSPETRLLVVLVIAHQRRSDAVTIEQLSSLPSVFARDPVNFAKDPDGAKSNVL